MSQAGIWGVAQGGLIVKAAFMLVILVCLLLPIYAFISLGLLRRIDSHLQKINLNMVDIFELLFSSKETNQKLIQRLNQLTDLNEAAKLSTNSINETLSQIRLQVEAQNQALKKINNNMIAIFKRVWHKA